MEIKFRAPHAIDATCLRSCVCAMAWRFHAIDATLSPSPRRPDGVEAREGPRDISQDNYVVFYYSYHSRLIKTCAGAFVKGGRVIATTLPSKNARRLSKIKFCVVFQE